VNLAQIEGTEVGEEGLVDEIVVNAKVEGVGAGLGRILVGDPVQPVRYNLYSLVFHIQLICFLLNLCESIHYY
jgi:hypothetical protein